jgi:hypothetical protein
MESHKIPWLQTTNQMGKTWENTGTYGKIREKMIGNPWIFTSQIARGSLFVGISLENPWENDGKIHDPLSIEV